MKALPAPAQDQTSDFKEHDWDTRRPGASWLNSNGGQEHNCLVCGVTLKQSTTRVDLPSKQYNYTDASGRSFTSAIPIGCPAFLGDHAGMSMANLERARKITQMVEQTGNVVENHEARLERLERENQELRNSLNATQSDIGTVVRWLGEMAALHRAAGLPTTQVVVAGRGTALLPEPVVDMILDLARIDTVVYVSDNSEND